MLVLQHGRERLHVLLVEGAAPHAVLVDAAVQQAVHAGPTPQRRGQPPHSQQVHARQHGEHALALQEERRQHAQLYAHTPAAPSLWISRAFAAA